MSAADSVVIRNIYYMMAYAFRALDVKEYARLGAESFESFADLMAAVLTIGMATQRRRGFEREYEEQREALHAVKGRIDVRGTMRLRAQLRSEVACTYDELTADTYKNRILRTCAQLLVARDDVQLRRRRDLRRCLASMEGVAVVDPHRIEWSRLRYHRNNGGYRFLMTVCYLVSHGFLMSEQGDDYRLARIDDGQQLHTLFEHFVFQYFAREHPELIVRAKMVDRGASEGAPEFLPRLWTDVTLQRRNSVLIIDTKCYGQILQARFEGKILSPAHLNQIQSYVVHESYGYPTEHVAGMVMYALTDHDDAICARWEEIGHTWHCRTLDLGQEFSGIARQLDEVAALV